MSLVLMLGATLTGGTSTTLTPAGLSAGGKASFIAPSSTRLTPRVLDITVGAPTAIKDNPGVARAGFKLKFASRVAEEGCCTVQAGDVIFDGNLRWPLSQPESVVDDMIAYVRAYVYTAEFADSVKKGILPT